MKKSAQVPATLIAAIAASLASNGCSGANDQCVDYAGRELPRSDCTSGTRGHWIHTGGYGTTGSTYGGYGG